MSDPRHHTNENNPALALHARVRDMLKAGMKEEEIVNKLRAEGVDEDYCYVVFANIENDLHDRRSFWKMLLGGLFITAGGLAINFFSHQIAVNTGSFFYYVFWGIVVSGVVMIIRAFIIFKG